MKVLRTALVLLVLMALCVGAVVYAADDQVVIDVIDGEAIVAAYKLKLADEELPITIDRDDTGVLVHITTTTGTVTLPLGDIKVQLSQRAVPYVKIADSANASPSASPTRRPSTHTTCKSCGKTYKNTEKDTHICPRCGLPYCAHDDIKCGYRLNPAPTPFSTKNAEGKNVYGGVSEDYSMYWGTPNGKAPTVWAPGPSFLPTASPSPSPIPGFPIDP